jgi:PadR family transcriptional regulator, regulatory protein PadR
LRCHNYLCRIRLMKALSHAATAVLQAVANGHQHGFDIMANTGLPSGTVYPALRRLEETAWLRSRWEEHRVARDELRPPRKYYEITKAGEAALAAALERYRGLARSGRPASAPAARAILKKGAR